MKIQVMRDVEVKYLHARFQPRYFEDSQIGDSLDTLEHDDQENPKMPMIKIAAEDFDGDFISKYEKDRRYIDWMIDIEEGRILDWPAGVVADVFYKVCDQGEYALLDENRNFVAWLSQDYVPRVLSITDRGYGDYMCIEVDKDGYIRDWDKSDILYELQDNER